MSSAAANPSSSSSSSESESPPTKRSLVIESPSIKPITRPQLYLKSEIKEFKFYHMWTIENFSYYCASENSPNKFPVLKSTTFSSHFNDKLQFSLELYPNGDDEDSKDNLSLYLQLDNCDRNEIVLSYDFWINDSDNDSLKYGKAKFIPGESWGYSKLCALENILKPTSKLAPGDALTIVCEICYDEMIDSDSYDLNEIALTQLENDCKQLSDNADLSNVVLVFGAGKNKKEILVHAAILGARSEVFAAMFEHNMQEKNKRRVEIPDVDAEVGQELVNYLYGQSIFLDTYAPKLLPIADKYQLTSLKSMCEDVLCFRINPESVENLLLLADMHNSAGLKSKCIEYIHRHSSCVLERENTHGMKNIMRLRPELYYELFKQIPKDLDVDSNVIVECLTWMPPVITSDPDKLSWSYTSSNVFKYSKLLTINQFDANHLSVFEYYIERHPHDFIETRSFPSPDNVPVQFRVKLYPHGENDDCKEHLSLYLKLKCDEKMKVAVKVKASIMVNANSAEGYSLEIVKRLSKGESIGWPKFIAHEQLMSNKDLLLNGEADQLVLLLEVFYIENIDKPVTMSGVNTFADEHKFSIARDLSQFYLNQKLTDIVFVIGNKELHAHKSIVSARSSVFARMFANTSQAQIKDFDDVETFEHLLALVYGQTEALTQCAHKMLPLVDKLELCSLRQVCQIALCSQLSDTNVAQFLLLADKHKATMLKAKAFEYIRRKHSVMTQNDSLKEIQQQNPKLFREILCYKLNNWRYLADK